ncbi:MAG TPA: glycosyltransferase family 1 protein [Steroidobacteraceae bacterium]|nr:glycosyltransferase family 1 protein [Steroidobacteraceae bacterium]
MLLDISRLIWRARRKGPSGIDRVELAYAQHFLAADARRPAYAVVHLGGYVFGVNPAGARAFVQGLAARWQGGAREGNAGRAPGIIGLYATVLLRNWTAGFHLRWRLKRRNGPAIFLVVSHHHLSLDYTIERIRRYFGARCVCFLHDLIPIDYPEYVQPGKARGHRRVTETIARRFDAVIVNSRSTAASLRHFLASEPHRSLPDANITVALPGVRAFPRATSPSTLPPGEDSVPYFIVLGTIEPKKNHLLLLNLWGRLSMIMATPPRLLVIGARGWENEQVVDLLERSQRLHGLVEEHNHLDDVGVGSLLAHARAVLVPSFVEGFGLPLAEALASEVPVICSDIPVFREVGGNVPDYIDPLDLYAWRDAVIDYADPDSARRAAQLERLAHWQPPGWPEHFEIVERALDAVAGSTGGYL